MNFKTHQVSETTQLRLFKDMLLSRLIEEKMLILLRQGKISKWFSGIGQEAVAVGLTASLDEDEFILPMHRNLAVFTGRNIPLYRLFSQWQGKLSGFTKGRDRSFHFGSKEHHIVGMISHLGPQLGVANGIALSHLLKGDKKVTAVFTGEGATSEGDFHEALNIAAVWDLPVLFCIENNGYGLSTPTNEQYRCENLADKGPGYGIESHILDGNNVLEVYAKVSELAADLREHPRPVLLEFKTFRMRGHEEASGTKYVPQKLMDQWAARDPLENFTQHLRETGVLSEALEVAYKTEIAHRINDHLDKAFAEDPVVFNEIKELDDLYYPFDYKHIEKSKNVKNIRLVDAVSEGLNLSMQRHSNLILMGQDIAEYGGVFKVTEGFLDTYGRERVRNTPICESAIVSTAMGLAINNFKAVVEMQFSDFVSSGFNPIVNYLAKVHYRWGQPADVVIRMPCGAGVGAGPFHSQTNEAWFTKVPGLKVVYPAFPEDAKGLLATAINDPNPVLFFEHKGLYRSVYGDVPEGYYTLPFGKAAHLREGNNLSLITYGAGVHWAQEALDEMGLTGVDLLDLRTLCPLDMEAVFQSVRKTGKALLLQEDTLFGGVMADVAAQIGEHCFESLDAPVKRVGSLEIPVPFARSLEAGFLPQSRLRSALEELLAY
ncbi:MAG: dehydrogenase E1 component subunit alpha/beta [Robiginitalea sp.]|uniref:alpha-ketoacid dehydrogenase subunit alpha/beta n=1 Tax=Robiginitalea sp. TaxID=1902411 RepID=UPI003C790A16